MFSFGFVSDDDGDGDEVKVSGLLDPGFTEAIFWRGIFIGHEFHV